MFDGEEQMLAELNSLGFEEASPGKVAVAVGRWYIIVDKFVGAIYSGPFFCSWACGFNSHLESGCNM